MVFHVKVRGSKGSVSCLQEDSAVLEAAPAAPHPSQAAAGHAQPTGAAKAAAKPRPRPPREVARPQVGPGDIPAPLYNCNLGL